MTDLATRPDGTRVPGAGASAAASERRPHLDGVRAVAVYLVVAFHAGLERFSGGFIGVDVFFVLSGYLVTQVLLRDRQRHGGTRFGWFYARRVRRLLPASVAMLVLTAPLYGAVADAVARQEAVSAYRSSFLYVANWHFIANSTDYFTADDGASPVLHLWSLAVEEQFYVLWPMLLAGLVWLAGRTGRYRLRTLQGLVLAGAVASAAWAWSLRLDDTARAYFGTEARAYQLLAGAALALAPGVIRRASEHRVAASALAAGGLAAMVGLSVLVPDRGPIVRGFGATAATVALLIGLDAAPAGPVARILGWRPLVVLGGLAYATYLWHWPVIVITTSITEISPVPLALLTALVATGIAALSSLVLETPIRTSARLDRFRWPIVALGLAISILGALLVPRLLDAGDGRAREPKPIPTDVEAFTPVPDWFDFGQIYFEKFGESVDCVEQSADACTVVKGSGPHVMLMGDSNAQMWIPAFTRMAEQRGLTLSLAVAPGCLWQRNAYKFNDAINAACRRMKEDAYQRTIDELDPDLLVLTNARESPGPPNPEFTTEAPVNEVLRRDTPASLDELASPGRRILIIESAPTPRDIEFNPLACLDEAEVVESCRFVADERTSWHDIVLSDEAAARDDVDIADLDRLICPFLPICDPIVGDDPVFWNSSHITTRYSQRIAPQLGTWLEDNGYLPATG